MMRISLFCMAFAVLSALATSTAWAHAGNLDQAPWHACEGLSLSTTCSFENAAHDVHRGTCRSVADTLVCVRNRPIEHPAATTQPAQAGVGFSIVALLVLLNVPLVIQRFTRRSRS